MNYENILFEIHERVGVLTFNRPKALNALSAATLDEVADVIESVARNDSIRVLVLTGAGDKAFVAGADINEFNSLNPLSARLFAEKGQGIFFEIERLPKPVIACVNGFALGGGCEIAMACDFIYASDKGEIRPTGSKSWADSGVWRNAAAIAPGGASQSQRTLHDRRNDRCSAGQRRLVWWRKFFRRSSFLMKP